MVIMSGQIVTVTVDCPMGCFHPEHPDLYYPINYGFISGTSAPDGEEEDAYILGVDHPVPTFTGRVIAVIHRQDDTEDKWVVAPEGATFSEDQIRSMVHFQEQYFHTTIRLL